MDSFCFIGQAPVGCIAKFLSQLVLVVPLGDNLSEMDTSVI